MEKQYHVYMMTNKRNTVIYTGFSSDLNGRVWQHKNKEDRKSFASRYNCNKLVYYAETNDVWKAIEAEKRIKAGSRLKKVKMDIYYLENKSLWLDIKIIFMTVLKVFKTEGVSH